MSNTKGIAALNVYKKVAIVRKSSDTLTYEDNGVTKTINDLAGAVSSGAVPSLKPKQKLDIPTPRIVTVDTYSKEMPPTFQAPKSYIRYAKATKEEEQEQVEYIADAEDEAWLHNNTKFGGSSKTSDGHRRPQVTLVMMERMMDLLEKATGFETIITTDQAERLVFSKIPEFFHLFPYKGPAGVVTSKHVISDIYNYWVQKRSKLKRPLLRRFWPVTASDDTNPHLVFRPREKEKYKLRKKRQNDMESFRKMKQLRSDFEKVRVLLDLVKRREELNRLMIQLQEDWFEQRMSDVMDTSGKPRHSPKLRRDEVERLLDIPRYFSTKGAAGGRGKNKRKRGGGWDEALELSAKSRSTFDVQMADAKPAAAGTAQTPLNVAGKNHGEPAPLFLHPLKTRESYVTSWDNAVPLVTSYVNTHAAPTFRFRHRPRLGRGGRMCIDRVPQPVHPEITPPTVFTAGEGLVHSVEPKKQLIDLLPRPLDHASVSRKIEEMCVSAIQEDYEIAATSSAAPAALTADAEENDCEEVLIKLNDWLDTDDQLWGEERFAIGPL